MRHLYFVILFGIAGMPTVKGRTVERVSVGDPPRPAAATSGWPSLSADGRYLTFHSAASNLVVGDTNGVQDVFVHDRGTGDLMRVSVASTGSQGNDGSGSASISQSGRFVAFTSFADDLVAGDTNGVADVFVHDRQTGETTRVSVSTAGDEGDGPSFGAAISADGNSVAFSSDAANLSLGDTNGSRDVFVHDRDSGRTVRVSVDSAGGQGNARSEQAAISADGRVIAFMSLAENLVLGDTNGGPDIFVHDRDSGQTGRVSVNSSGAESNSFFTANPAISADGRYVTFDSDAEDLDTGPDLNGLADIFVHDRQTAQTVRLTNGNGDHLDPSISGDGRRVIFTSCADNLVSGDTNGRRDVFVHDRDTDRISRVSVDSAGGQGDDDSGIFTGGVAISADGNVAAFESLATNLIRDDNNGAKDLLVHDLQTRMTTLGSVSPLPRESNDDPFFASVADGGDLVAFSSDATTLVQGDTNLARDVFIRDLTLGQTIQVSVSSPGVAGDDTSDAPAISADGRFVAFESLATNLVNNDLNATFDVFVHDLQTRATARISVDAAGMEGDDMSLSPSISSDGRYVAFVSYAKNLVPNDMNSVRDVFVHDRQTGQIERVSVSSSGAEANDDSGELRFSFSERYISADGRLVAFTSAASNLVPGDNNNYWDIFVHDRQTGATTRVSVDSAGDEANADTIEASLSPDGRFVAFSSGASNLVPGDANGFTDIFLHDRQDGSTRRISVDSSGVEADDMSFNPSIAAGGFVVFVSYAKNLVPMDTNFARDIFLHDALASSTIRVSLNGLDMENDGEDDWPSISTDGNHVVFRSDATDLVSDDTNGLKDIFLVGLATAPPSVLFVRGDADANGVITLNDCIFTIGCLILGTTCPTCLDAADSDDNGQVTLNDCTFSLGCLFLSTACPPPPFPACGDDPTADALTCSSFQACP